MLQSALAFGPVEDVSPDVDKHIAKIVHHLFDDGMWEKSYKDIVEDKVTQRPGKCSALTPVEGN